MASTSINLPIDEYMDSDLYWEAARARSGPALERNSEHLANLQTPNGNTLLHICITSAPTLSDHGKKKTTDIGHGALSSVMTFIESVLERCPELLSKPNKNGETPLHLAARWGHEPLVKLLVERAKGQKDMILMMLRMASYEENDTALHLAVRFNHVGVVKILMNEDPDHYKYPANKAGNIPLFVAVERGHRDLVHQIISNCPLSSPPSGDPHGRNVLHAAAIVGLEGEILENWGNLAKETDDKGWTPLHYAADAEQPSTLRKLLQFDKSPSTLTLRKLLQFDKSAAYIKDKKGRTALHIAASHGHDKMMKDFIFNCPDCFELVDKRGRNVLHFALESNQHQAVEVITNESAFSNLLNGIDSDGNTPLHLIAGPSGPDNKHILKGFVDLDRVDVLALNNKNQNALDIISTNKKLSASDKGKHFAKQLKWKIQASHGKPTSSETLLWKGLEWIIQASHGKPTSSEVSDADEKENRDGAGGNTAATTIEKENRDGATIEKENSDGDIEKAHESTLITATLIATVTFAAPFTMPGGYVGNDGPGKAGTAILVKSAAFKAFMITDTIAMCLSTFAVLCHILVVLQKDNSAKQLAYNAAAYYTMDSMAMMMIAFATGTYAVLDNSKGLAIFVCFFAVLTALPYFYYAVKFTFKVAVPVNQYLFSPFLTTWARRLE